MVEVDEVEDVGEMSSPRVGVVGGGIVGLAIGREISERYPGIEVVVFEKEPDIAAHQTGRNSGVVHAGIYYRPGSLKAELCAEGRRKLRDYCVDRQLPYVECGKLVIAIDDAERGRLDQLERTATVNGVPGLRRLDATRIREVEPHATGLAALHSPATAITDFVAVAHAFADDIVTAGGTVLCSTMVAAIEPVGDAVSVVVEDGTGEGVTHRLSHVVVCGGLQADRLSRPVDGQASPAIVPFRGEYMDVHPDKRDLVRGLIYPVPDPRYPFLGVHFTRRVSGLVDIGPNAVLALAREGYRGRFATDLGDVRSIARDVGFWRLARNHWRTGVREMLGSLSVKAYMRTASRYVPEIGPADVTRSASGIRAQAVDRDGSLVDDFRINDLGRVVTIRNAPSPAATSSLAIARHVVDRVRFV